MNRVAHLLIAIALFGCAVSIAHAQPAQGSFQAIPTGSATTVHGVSGNGLVVVGRADNQAFKWSDAQGVTFLTSGLPFSDAWGANSDGSVVVGEMQPNSQTNSRAFKWTAASGAVNISGGFDSRAAAVSANGAAVVGHSFFSDGSLQAARWTGGPAQGLGTINGVSGLSYGWGISADGSVICGESSEGGGSGDRDGFRWTGSMTGLGADTFRAHAVSADGNVIVGMSVASSVFSPFRAVGSTATSLGVLGSGFAAARDVSGDGAVVVGTSGGLAFIWDAQHGTRALKPTLETDYGLDLTGWSLTDATGISDNGRVIVGIGSGPGGATGWIAVLPEPDTDGDGLLDSWETVGVPYTDSNGIEQDYLLDWDEDGVGDADPNVKDIFVEDDAMGGLAPSAASIAMVQSKFTAHNIRLHLLVDDVAIPTSEWTLDDTNGNGTPDWPTEFDALKLTAASGGGGIAGYFGTLSDRTDPDAAGIREARKKAWRYCIFGRAQDPGDSTSGRGELPGNDFMVTLGLWDFGGDADQRAGTFMHELGHTLGLRHGGGDDINYKPNYYSVMSYNWQTPKGWHVAGSWPLSPGRPGFSDFAMQPPLNEASLTECVALAAPGSSLSGFGFPHNTHADGSIPPVVFLTRFDFFVDWNVDAACSPTPVAVDVTRIYNDVAPSPGEVLNGHDDWDALIYNFRELPSFPDGVHHPGSGDGLHELTEEENQAMSNLLPPYCAGDIVADRSVNVSDLLAVIAGWGSCPSGCLADIAPLPTDGQVNVTDLLAVIGAWGPCQGGKP